jgi:membrane-bound lytic murein transglycosylase A
MAVDREFIPLGTILWLETDSPKGSLNKLVIAEDVGSAIKGAVRGDYFWGSGEEALKYAGKMNAKGKYFVVLPKKSKVVVYGR